MAEKKKTKTRYIDLSVKEGSFASRLVGAGKSKYNIEDISILRSLLSNEKARILHTIKKESPKSIYNLAKKLGRDFKSVREDAMLLEKFGFIEFHTTKTGKRKALTPILSIDSLEIVINI
jgi:predicted transcriptional regulator